MTIKIAPLDIVSLRMTRNVTIDGAAGGVKDLNQKHYGMTAISLSVR